MHFGAIRHCSILSDVSLSRFGFVKIGGYAYFGKIGSKVKKSR